VTEKDKTGLSNPAVACTCSFGCRSWYCGFAFGSQFCLQKRFGAMRLLHGSILNRRLCPSDNMAIVMLDDIDVVLPYLVCVRSEINISASEFGGPYPLALQYGDCKCEIDRGQYISTMARSTLPAYEPGSSANCFSHVIPVTILAPKIKYNTFLSFPLRHIHSPESVIQTRRHGTFEASSIPLTPWRMLSKSCRDRAYLASCYTRILALAFVELSASNYWRGTNTCRYVAYPKRWCCLTRDRLKFCQAQSGRATIISRDIWSCGRS
jgi:hypothetical protein